MGYWSTMDNTDLESIRKLQVFLKSQVGTRTSSLSLYIQPQPLHPASAFTSSLSFWTSHTIPCFNVILIILLTVFSLYFLWSKSTIVNNLMKTFQMKVWRIIPEEIFSKSKNIFGDSIENYTFCKHYRGSLTICPCFFNDLLSERWH